LGLAAVSETILAADGPGLTLKSSEFRQISQLAYERFGLDLKQGKEALVAARLGKRLRQRGFKSFTEYYDHILADKTGESLIELIDSLTTNHTSFLRERAHFEFLIAAVREEFRDAGTVDIWSAACSSGEEPYSIAMSLLDAGVGGGAAGRGQPTVRSKFRILATDISTRVLAIAQRGVYDGERFRELPEAWRRAFLLRGEGQCSGLFKIRPELAKLVEFDRVNLIEPFTHGRAMHAIFCRNVMMYFDKSTQQNIVQRLGACLAPGGYLFVGHSESLTGVEHDLEYVRPAVYRRGKQRGGSRGRA
jgi:chemotaxis protein methyltransferase CheR